MDDWEQFVETCPACTGEGCEICAGTGRLVVPDKIQVYVTKLQHSRFEMKKVRVTMLDTYLRWQVSNNMNKQRIIQILMETLVYDNLENTEAGRQELDRRMTKDILDMEERLKTSAKSIENGKGVVDDARDRWRRAKRAVKEREAPPAPPPIEHVERPETKAAGRICRFPKCKKKPYAWDEKGQGWCKKHAYEKGLLEREKFEEEVEDAD